MKPKHNSWSVEKHTHKENIETCQIKMTHYLHDGLKNSWLLIRNYGGQMTMEKNTEVYVKGADIIISISSKNENKILLCNFYL